MKNNACYPQLGARKGALVIVFSLALFSLSLGCGALRAMSKPSTLTAPKDDAPLTVVVQRAQAARTTAAQVERLLATTPADNDSVWPKQTQLSATEVARVQKQIADHPYYDGTSLRVSSAIVWADELASIHNETGTNPSLLAALSPEIGAGYKELQARVADLATLQARLASEKTALDKEGISEADEKTHQANADSLQVQIDKSSEALDPAKAAFIASCKQAAAKVPADVREHYAIALVNLRQAVHDADIANGCASLRYSQIAVQVVQNPVALHDSLVAAAKANVSDYIFEQTGKRLKLSGLSPAVTLDNGTVDLTLNGIGPDDLGAIQLDQLLAETTVRTGRFAIDAVSLLATSSATDTLLSFEAEVLDAIFAGFQDSGWQASAAVQVAEQTSAEIHAGATASSAGQFALFGK